MLFDIELSKDEIIVLESWGEERLKVHEFLAQHDKDDIDSLKPHESGILRQISEILLQKIKFMKLQIQGHGLEAAANLLHLAEVPDYAPERADAWHDK